MLCEKDMQDLETAAHAILRVIEAHRVREENAEERRNEFYIINEKKNRIIEYYSFRNPFRKIFLCNLRKRSCKECQNIFRRNLN